MYLIVALNSYSNETMYFGPFTTEDRAKEYATTMLELCWSGCTVVPLVVPNCTLVAIANRK